MLALSHTQNSLRCKRAAVFYHFRGDAERGEPVQTDAHDARKDDDVCPRPNDAPPPRLNSALNAHASIAHR